MSKWQPRRLSPLHYEILRLAFLRYPNGDIATTLGVSYQTVSNVLTSDEGLKVLSEMSKGTLDLTVENLMEIQAVTPYIVKEKIRLALESKDDRVRSTSCNDVLALAGLQPIQKIQVEHIETIREKYADKSEAEIRAELLSELTETSTGDPGTTGTVH